MLTEADFRVREGESFAAYAARIGWRWDAGEYFESCKARRLREQREDGGTFRQDAGEGDDDGPAPDADGARLAMLKRRSMTEAADDAPDAAAAQAAMVDRKTLAWKVPRAPRATHMPAAPSSGAPVDPFEGETFDPAQHTPESALAARIARKGGR